MATLKLDVHPYQGEYEIPTLSQLTNGELNRIKTICGVPAGRLAEAVGDGDVGVLVAFTAVILERAGLQVDVRVLWDANAESFEMIQGETEEDVDRPPATATSGGPENENAAVANEKWNSEPSGNSGTSDGDDSQTTPIDTGSPGSVTPVDFARETSAA